MKNLFFTAIVLCFICSGLNSCKEHHDPPTDTTSLELIGKVDGSPGREGDININGFFVQPLFTGSLKKDGSFSIILPENFIDSTKQFMRRYNASDSAQYQLQPTSLSDYFLAIDGILTENLSQPAALAGKYYTFNLDHGGTLIPASSLSFMEQVISDQIQQIGFYYFFIYSAEDFSLNGTTTQELGSDETPIHQNYSYTIDGRKGWNILKYEVKEVQTIAEGVHIPIRIAYSSMNALPADFKWKYKP